MSKITGLYSYDMAPEEIMIFPSHPCATSYSDVLKATIRLMNKVLDYEMVLSRDYPLITSAVEENTNEL